MDRFKTLESDFLTPFSKIYASVIEGLAELGQPIEGHQETLHVLTSIIINESLDRD
ncbi:MAG: hypothetical protein HOI66_18705 [Verrucomicrobia bacterium]|jgi:hypothetical protein|nr:hypothetical protein [Verrucomicrobiota bacterium]